MIIGGVTLHSTQPGAAGVLAKSPPSKRPKMPMELPGEDRGSDPSLQPGERERENDYRIIHTLLKSLLLFPF